MAGSAVTRINSITMALGEKRMADHVGASTRLKLPQSWVDRIVHNFEGVLASLCASISCLYNGANL